MQEGYFRLQLQLKTEMIEMGNRAICYVYRVNFDWHDYRVYPCIFIYNASLSIDFSFVIENRNLYGQVDLIRKVGKNRSIAPTPIIKCFIQLHRIDFLT